MAGEIQIQAASGNTVYALLYDINAKIYNGSSFEVWSDGNINNYDIILSEQGSSGFYAGDFPIIAEGIYSVVAKRQVAGAPSTSDVLVGAGNIAWDGTSVVSGTGGGTLAEYEINVGHSEREIDVVDGISSSLSGQRIVITKGNESQTDSGGIQISTGVDKA